MPKPPTPTTAPTPPTPRGIAASKPGTRTVIDRLGVTPGALHERHADKSDSLHGLAVLIDTIATDVDRATTTLVDDIHRLIDTLNRALEAVPQGRLHEAGILQGAGPRLDATATHHAIAVRDLNTLVDAYKYATEHTTTTAITAAAPANASARPAGPAPRPTRRRTTATAGGPCPCVCNHGGFCGGCGHAGCGGR
ncbi:hypothetical protein OG948_58655 (plasmid) [Embleya sp. NBC_00888]|uniref:hypothetical protein n=1 Tax=Embleya sp. NBC_00888 TaxID=2975960 RepID=UPI002F90F1BB|nr:hypothetical protein OG948_58655 [Embleya sp. NBC_00888]